MAWLGASPHVNKYQAHVSGLLDWLEPISGLSQKEQGREVARPRDQNKFLCTETKVHQTKYIAKNLQAYDEAMEIIATDGC
jgi:hypothetical protein